MFGSYTSRGLPQMNRSSLLDFLAGGRRKDYRPTKKSNTNILLVNGDPVVQYHSAYIAKFNEDGSIAVAADGWESHSTTRQALATVARLNVFTLKAKVSDKVRVRQGYRCMTDLGFDVPFVDGMVVRNGRVVWHPYQKELGCELKDITEPAVALDEDQLVEYKARRRDLLAKLRPIARLIDEAAADRAYNIGSRVRFATHALYNADLNGPEAYDIARRLIADGAPTGRQWGAASFDQNDTVNYLRRGLDLCVGKGGWGLFAFKGIAVETRVRCGREV